MATKTLALKQSLTAAAAATALLLNVSPFMDGESARVVVSYSADAAGACVVKVQGSDDNVTFTDLLTQTGVGPDAESEVVCSKYMRANVTTVGSAGTVSVYLEGLT